MYDVLCNVKDNKVRLIKFPINICMECEMIYGTIYATTIEVVEESACPFM